MAKRKKAKRKKAGGTPLGCQFLIWVVVIVAILAYIGANSG